MTNVPGWKRAEPGTDASLQLVDGEWYFPAWGCDSLQMTVDAIDELVDMLAEVQFDQADRCPVCHGGVGLVEWHHTKTCRLANMLKRYEDGDT